jgi:hypothetical protein
VTHYALCGWLLPLWNIHKEVCALTEDGTPLWVDRCHAWRAGSALGRLQASRPGRQRGRVRHSGATDSVVRPKPETASPATIGL